MIISVYFYYCFTAKDIIYVYISFSLTAKDITHEISVIETDCVSTVRETTFQFDVNYIFNVSIMASW